MALDSTSTQAEAENQLKDNLLWEGDATKAQNFVEAGRWLLAFRAQMSADARTRIDFASIERQVDKAAGFVAGVTGDRASVTRARMKMA